MVGKKIAHYDIIKKVGEGGMGAVYLAHDNRLKRQVALKFYLANKEVQEEEKQRFFQEAQAAARLDHPNICTVYEIGETGDHTYIAMSYVDGNTLKEMMKKERLPLDEVLRIAIETVGGLNEAHEAGIIHRDVKSTNIMLTAKGMVKVMDFGIAKMMEGPDLTRQGSTLGTLAYMSPEQVNGQQIDFRTDIWSMGVLLYEMLTGTHPFRGRQYEIMKAIVDEEPRPVRDFHPTTPPKLEGIVMRCLEKSPDDRFQTMGEMLEELEDISNAMATRPFRQMQEAAQETRSLQQDSDPSIAVNRTAAQKKRRLMTIAGGFLLIVIAASLWFTLQPEVEATDARLLMTTRADSARAVMTRARESAVATNAQTTADFISAGEKAGLAENRYRAELFDEAAVAFMEAEALYQSAAGSRARQEAQLRKEAQQLETSVAGARGKVSAGQRSSRRFREAQALESAAANSQRDGDPAKAVEHYQRALVIFKQLSAAQPAGKASPPAAPSSSLADAARKGMSAARQRARDGGAEKISAFAAAGRLASQAERQYRQQQFAEAAVSYRAAEQQFETALRELETLQAAEQKSAESQAAQQEKSTAMKLQVDQKISAFDDSYHHMETFQQAQRYHEEAGAAINNGDYSAAIQSLERADRLFDATRNHRRSQIASIQNVITAYESALRGKNLAQLKQIYPRMSGTDEKNWKQFFKYAENLDVRLTSGRLNFFADRAESRISALLTYEINGDKTEQNSQWQLQFTTAANGWTIYDIR